MTIVWVIVTLTLEIWGTDPLRGRVRAPSGDDQEFTGWLGLARALGEATDGWSQPAPHTAAADQ